MKLTEALVARTVREVADSGPLPGVTYFTEDQYDENLRDILSVRPPGPIYVFAYGSLIWKPVFEPVSVARAVAKGWERSFCLKVARFRGTIAQPGLMMQIDRGGQCEGVIHEVEESRHWDIMAALWRREMTTRPPGNLPLWIDVECRGTVKRAIAFTANHASPNYAGKLSPDYVAQTLAVACGCWGSGAQYLYQTVVALRESGVHDEYLWDLQERVASEIERNAQIN